MKIPTIKILTGRKTLRDWFEFVFRICNHIDFTFSIFGYGIKFNWVVKNPTDSLND